MNTYSKLKSRCLLKINVDYTDLMWPTNLEKLSVQWEVCKDMSFLDPKFIHVMWDVMYDNSKKKKNFFVFWSITICACEFGF